MKDVTWLNIKTTMMVRKMKKPSDDITDTQWSTIKHVLDVMSGFANDEGDNIYPSYKLIGQYTALGERTVYRSIAYLLKHKILIKKQSYSLNIPLVIQLAAACETVVDEPKSDSTAYWAESTAYQAVKGDESLPIGQSSLPIGHINKELRNTYLKNNNKSVLLFKELIKYGFSKQEANSLLTQHGEVFIGGHLAYLEATNKVTPITNIPAWLRKAISLNWANVSIKPKPSIPYVPPAKGNPEGEAYRMARSQIKGYLRSVKLS